MDDIKKATPPPIPQGALKQPNHEPESPFDVISSAPKPEASKEKPKLAMPQWLGRPILHPDHSQQLEMNAAVNEFGLKMPRQQAEDQAYKDYLYHPKTGQYAQAAHHHLLGVRAADAAGDKEAARKHYMMYTMHAKALGKDPDQLALELGNGEGQDMPKVYKFKAHKGDAFAIQPPPSMAMARDLQPNGVFASAPKLGKAQEEKLHELYNLASEALAKAEKHYTHYEGRRDEKTGSVETPCGKDFPQTSARTRSAWRHVTCPKCLEHKPADTKKGEMSAKAKHCKCGAYDFPHRHGGGRCNAVKP